MSWEPPCRDSVNRNIPAASSIAMLLVPLVILRSIFEIGDAPQLQFVQEPSWTLNSPTSGIFFMKLAFGNGHRKTKTPWLVTLPFYYYRYSHSRHNCHPSGHPCAYFTYIALLIFFLDRTRCLHLQCHLKSLFFIFVFRGWAETKTIEHTYTCHVIHCILLCFACWSL